MLNDDTDLPFEIEFFLWDSKNEATNNYLKLKVMKKRLIFLLCLSYCYVNAQVTLTTDFTNNSNNKGAIYDSWTVANRISPMNGSGVNPTLGVNTVRMVGGILKTVNGVKVPDLDFDPVTYNTSTNKYVYNWTSLKSRINAIRNEGVRIHQIVLDQVPWCFQRGYTFIPTGTRDNVHFRENEKISVYGNSLPPFDKVAYSNFIKAMITELVATYGQAEVQSWRLRVGSEIETPDHWFGTEQDFIDHYANTVKAVLSVLPNVKIGLHTREPAFLYRNGSELNYKGQVIKSFANGLINYCYGRTDVRYDFWGISDYLLINSSTDRDFTTKYNIYYKPIVENPKWNSNATCDVMEYSIVTTMGAPDGKGYLTVATPHADIINLAYTNVFYDNANKGLRSFYRWGTRPTSTESVGIAMLKSMNGNTRFLTNNTGSPAISTNKLDAIVTKGNNNSIDAIVYNYNSSSLNYQADETVKLYFLVDLPVGSVVKYRSLTYGKNQNDLENFLLNEPSSGWIKAGFDRRGDPSRTLNTAGAAAWANYTNPTTEAFGSWANVTTTDRTGSGNGSEIKLNATLGSFSLKKYEIEVVSIPAQTPYTTTRPIPGIIEAENYDKGGEGIAYHDTSSGNTGNAYRTDDVDLGTVPASQGGGYCVGWTNTGEWMEYRVNVLNAGNYNLAIRYSSGVAGAKIGASFPDEGITLFSNLDLAQTTGGYNGYEVRTKYGIPLTAGYHTLRISVDQKGFNLDKLDFFEPFGGINTAPISQHVENKLNLVPDNTNKVLVYPNPSNTGVFTINKSGSWKVFNLSGAKILEGKGDKIDLSGFAKGIYTLQTETSSHKLIYN